VTILPLCVARSSSDGIAIFYVLPVLWMTSCFHMCIHKGRQNGSQTFNQILLNDNDQPIPIMSCAPRAKSALYDVLFTNKLWDQTSHLQATFKSVDEGRSLVGSQIDVDGLRHRVDSVAN